MKVTETSHHIVLFLRDVTESTVLVRPYSLTSGRNKGRVYVFVIKGTKKSR